MYEPGYKDREKNVNLILKRLLFKSKFVTELTTNIKMKADKIHKLSVAKYICIGIHGEQGEKYSCNLEWLK